MMRTFRPEHSRRAVTAVQVLVTLPVLIGAAAMAVDVGVMFNARGDMQRAVDAAALAAITELAYPGDNANPTATASQAAVEYIERNAVMGRTLTITPENAVIFGRADYNASTNRYNFMPGQTPTNAVQVTLEQTDDSPNGSLPLYFGSILGKSHTNISAQATAMFVETGSEKANCGDTAPPGQSLICRIGDSDDSDDSAAGDSDDSDDSDPGDSDGSVNGDSDDSDDSEAGDSDDSDDSQGDGENHGQEDGSENPDADSDTPHTFLIDAAAMPFFLETGATAGPCSCAGDGHDNEDGQTGEDDNGEGAPSITLCHIPAGNPDNPQTITVDEAGAAVHLAHGDTLGVCDSDRGVRIFLIN